MKQTETYLSHEIVEAIDEAIGRYGKVPLVVIYDDVSGIQVKRA